jgi:hypothetical protein
MKPTDLEMPKEDLSRQNSRRIAEAAENGGQTAACESKEEFP